MTARNERLVQWQRRRQHVFSIHRPNRMTTEETALEAALRLAASDPAARPDFYRLLLESEVFVIGATAHKKEGARTLDAGEKIGIQNWTRKDGSSVVPFFTSLDALQRAISEPADYLKLDARAL